MSSPATKSDGDAAKNALVSVIIPAYNARTTIMRALRSVADQTYRPFEVIVVDDGSIDGTAELASAFQDIPVRVERLQDQGGAAAARNRGIAICAGTFIAFLDADDEWLPHKTEIQMAAFAREADASFVTCDAVLVSPGARINGLVNPGRPGPNGQNAWKTLLKHPCVATPCVIVKRAVLDAVGGFDAALTIGEDQDLWIRLALRGPVHHIKQSLVHVYDRPHSLSKAHRGNEIISTLPMIVRHLQAQKHRLSDTEVAEILGSRYTAVGRSCYETGNLRDGLRLLLSAVGRGHKPMENLAYLVAASPPMRFAKRLTGLQRDLPEDAQHAQIATNVPLLTVVVDTEEEFDWERPFRAGDRAVNSINQLHLAQSIHEKHGLIPTYVVDYPVVSDDNAVAILKEFVAAGKAQIGAHLQPWVNPPFEEREELPNTYPGNLPYSLEYKKLARLTEAIQTRFGVQPVVYKAGRYGLGPSSGKILKSLGYEIDASVLPFTNLGYQGGPDFTCFPNTPYWFGEDLSLLEVPLTRGFTGALRGVGGSLFSILGHPIGETLHLPGLFARLGLLERITLTPEGILFDEQRRLTEALLKRRHKVFSFTYHSSSLLPGATQYVRTPADREAFLEAMDRYFDFFLNTVGGKAATLTEIRTLCLADPRAPRRREMERKWAPPITPAVEPTV